MATSLGWFGLGLGAAQLLFPATVARLIGVKPSRGARLTMRLIGAREALIGLGLLSRRGRASWLGARVAGDAIDAALLGGVLANGRSSGIPLFGFGGGAPRARAGMALAGVAAVGAVDVMAQRLAAQVAAEAIAAAPPPVIRASVTINRPAAELYAFWRDVENLPRFLTRVGAITAIDQNRSHWEMKGALGQTVDWTAAIVEEEPGERIRWEIERSRGSVVEGAEVTFRPASRGRGTEVHVALRLSRGATGRAVGGFLRQLPERWIGQDLRRLKQLMELGEITHSDASVHVGPHPARPSAPGVAEGGAR